MNIRVDLLRSHQLHDDPGHAVALTMLQLTEAVKDLEGMRADPLAGRHVDADRKTIQQMALRLIRLGAER